MPRSSRRRAPPVLRRALGGNGDPGAHPRLDGDLLRVGHAARPRSRGPARKLDRFRPRPPGSRLPPGNPPVPGGRRRAGRLRPSSEDEAVRLGLGTSLGAFRCMAARDLRGGPDRADRTQADLLRRDRVRGRPLCQPDRSLDGPLPGAPGRGHRLHQEGAGAEGVGLRVGRFAEAATRPVPLPPGQGASISLPSTGAENLPWRLLVYSDSEITVCAT